jgi:hypothetical protein
MSLAYVISEDVGDTVEQLEPIAVAHTHEQADAYVKDHPDKWLAVTRVNLVGSDAPMYVNVTRLRP